MKPKKICVAALVLILLIGTVAAKGAPKGLEDPGDGFFVPDPPAPKAPPTLAVDSLGILTIVSVTGQALGETTTVLYGGMSIISTLEADGSLIVKATSGLDKRQIELPPLPDGESLDYDLRLTPYTLAVDRFGDNTAATSTLEGKPASFGNIDASKVRDLTVPVYGMVESANIEAVSLPDTASHQIKRVDLVQQVTDPLEYIALDPEDELRVIRQTADLTTAEATSVDAAPRLTTKSAIQTALETISVDSLTIDGALDALNGATEELAVVAISEYATNLEADGIGVKEVTDVGLGEFFAIDIRDPTNVDLVAVNGALGKITLYHGTDFDLTEDKLVALRDQTSTRLLSYTALVKHGEAPDVDYSLAKARYEPDVGDTVATLNKGVNLLRSGSDLYVHNLEKPDLRTKVMPTDQLGVVYTARGGLQDTVGSLKAAAIVGPARNATHIGMPGLGYAVCERCVLDQLSLVRPPAVGAPSGFGVAGTPDVGGLSFPRVEAAEVPDTGIGSVPEVDRPQGLPEHDVAPGLGFADPSFLSAIHEMFPAPAMPGLIDVVPLDTAAGVASMVSDVQGNAVALVPVDAMKALPVGQATEFVVRFVGEAGSLFSQTGISGVTATVTSSDPLGLSQSTQSGTSNANGYVTWQIPTGAEYSVVGRHDKYDAVSGSGQIGFLGDRQGQEYTMESQGSGTTADFVRNNSLVLVIAAVAVLAIGYFWWRQRK